jgi:hypothetical protein
MGDFPGATPAPAPRFRLSIVDLLVGAWVVLWIAVAVAVAVQVRDLRGLGDTVVVAAESVDTAARALQRTADAIETTRAGLGQTVQGLNQIRSTLDALGSIPLVGGIATGGLADAVDSLVRTASRLQALQTEVETLAGDTRVTAASARASGLEASNSVGTLAILFALAIALIPTVPILVTYVPRRLRRRWAP